MKTVLLILGGIFLSFLAIRLWIFIVDTFFKGLKYLNPFRKKEKINWHTLDDDTVETKEQKRQATEYIDDTHHDII